MPRCEHLLPIISLIVLYCYIIISLIVSISERTSYYSSVTFNIHDTSAAVVNIISNLNTQPLKDLKVVSLSETCPPEFSSEKLFTWSTISRWCLCPLYVSSGSCDSSEDHCKNKTKISYEIYNWKGMKFCSQRMPKEDWELANSYGRCSSYNFMKCSGDLICIQKDSKTCPINSITLGTPSAEAAPKYQALTLPDKSAKPIFISRDTNNLPLISIKATISALPCVNNKRDPQRNSKLVYPILNENPSGCDKYGTDDLSSNVLDSQLEWNFYEDNSLTNKLDQLPGYKKFVGEEQAMLIANYRIGMNKKRDDCISTNFDILSGPTEHISVLEEIRNISNLLCFLAMTVAIGLNVYLLCEYKTLSFPRIGPFKVCLAITIVYALASLICSSLSTHYIKEIDEVKELLISVGNVSCFHYEQYNVLFEEVRNYLLFDFGRTKTYVFIDLFLAIVFLLLVVLYKLYLLYIQWALGRLNYENV